LSSILVSDIGINYETKIAEILGKIDDKIELNLKINYTLEAMAQAIFKSWFVDFDPVKAKIAAIEAGEDSDGVTRAAISAISGKTDEELDQLQAEQPEHYIQLKNTAELFPSTMQESELGEIPDGWEVKSLYDFAQYINGAAFKSEDFSSNHEGLPIIKIRELKYGITPQTEFTKKEFDQKYRINNGEILFSWSGSPDTSIDIFLWTGGNGWLNQHTFRVIPQEAEEKEFIFFLLKFFKKSFIEIARNKQTTGLGHVTSKDLKNMFASFPTKNVIKLFNDVGEPIVSKIFFNSTENNNLSKIRDFLLPKLLSGELSVEAVEFAEE
jgi:type I restriction enzyme S subunit